MANSTNQIDQNQTRFSYYNFDFNVTQNLLREDQYADNALIATIQKIIKLVGVVVVGGLEALKNGAKLIANGFIYLANVANDYFNPSTLKNKQVEVLQPASSSSSSSSAKPNSLAPLEIDETDIDLICEPVPVAPSSPTDLDGIPFADLIPTAATPVPAVQQEPTIEQPAAVQQPAVDQPAEPVVKQEEIPVQPIVEQPPVVQQPIVDQAVEPVVKQEEAPVQEKTGLWTPEEMQAMSEVPAQPATEVNLNLTGLDEIQQPVLAESQTASPAGITHVISNPEALNVMPETEISAPVAEDAQDAADIESEKEEEVSLDGTSEPSSPVSPKESLSAPNEAEESDEELSVESKRKVSDASEGDDSVVTKPNEGSLEIEVPKEIADRILNRPQAPTYRALDPRRAWQWFFKKSA